MTPLSAMAQLKNFRLVHSQIRVRYCTMYTLQMSNRSAREPVPAQESLGLQSSIESR